MEDTFNVELVSSSGGSKPMVLKLSKAGIVFLRPDGEVHSLTSLRNLTCSLIMLGFEHPFHKKPETVGVSKAKSIMWISPEIAQGKGCESAIQKFGVLMVVLVEY